MFHPLLKEKYEYLTGYFEKALTSKQRGLHHSIVFYGADVLGQYYLAQSIAKILNCSESRNSGCECINCRWIKENAHPAVLTISKLDNKNEGDTAKTVISINQMRALKNSIANTSNYHRIFIFCDAQVNESGQFQKDNLELFSQVGIELPQQSQDKIWYPKPLNSQILHDEAANAILKALEEPPENVTYFFLTKDKDDLISTIISRSQCFYVPAFLKETYETNFFAEFFSSYPQFEKTDFLNRAKYTVDYLKENSIADEYFLTSMQNYLVGLAKENIGDKALINSIKKDVSVIQQAKNELNSSVKSLNVFESLYLRMT